MRNLFLRFRIFRFTGRLSNNIPSGMYRFHVTEKNPAEMTLWIDHTGKCRPARTLYIFTYMRQFEMRPPVPLRKRLS
jgi:hypothetical protein